MIVYEYNFYFPIKINPTAIIAQAADYPVAVENRSKVQAYLIGKNLFEKLMSFLEDQADAGVVAKTDFSKDKDFEIVAKDLGI